MSSMIPLDRDAKLMLLQVLKRGGWTLEDVEKLPNNKDVTRVQTKAELLADLERYGRIEDAVTIDASKAKELAKAGLLDFNGKHYILTEWARNVRAGKATE